MTSFEIYAAQLEALLETENMALSRMDVDAVAALTSEKNRLVDVLRDLGPKAATNSDSGLIARVQSLSRTSDANKALLERAMLVNRRLMAVVASAARPANTEYGRSGAATGHSAVQPRAIVAQA